MARNGGNGNDVLHNAGYFWNGWFWLFAYDTELNGFDGDDVLKGFDRADRNDGGNGNDWMGGWFGNDTLIGGNGNDTLWGESDHDLLYGGAGDDRLEGHDGNDTLHGEDGNDWMHGGLVFGTDYLYGGAGNDTLYGFDGNDLLDGGSGDDQLYAEFGFDTLNGGEGNDLLTGGVDNDILSGGAGTDTIDGWWGNDRIFGESGDDEVTGGLGSDTIFGGEGNDVLRAGESLLIDKLTHAISGGNGNDFIVGDTRGNDTLQGDDGNDIILAGDSQTDGSAKDLLIGGAGQDTFLLAGSSDQVNTSSSAKVLKYTKEGVALAGKIAEAIAKVGTSVVSTQLGVGLAFSAVSAVIGIVSEVLTEPKGGANDFAWIKDFTMGQDTLVLAGKNQYKMSTESSTNLGLGSANDSFGLAIYKTSAQLDLVAFIETGSGLGSREQANQLHDQLIANQIQGNGFRIYGQSLNSSLLAPGTELNRVLGTLV